VNYAKGHFGVLVVRSNDKRKDGIIIWNTEHIFKFNSTNLHYIGCACVLKIISLQSKNKSLIYNLYDCRDYIYLCFFVI